METTTALKFPGKHPDTEEDILLYLHNHPDGTHTTLSIANDLDDSSRPRDEFVAEVLATYSLLGTPEGFNPETVRVTRRPAEVQSDIESLIIKRLVDGYPTGKPGSITHKKIKLTKIGRREALIAKNRIRTIVTNIPRPDHQPRRPPVKPEFDV